MRQSALAVLERMPPAEEAAADHSWDDLPKQAAEHLDYHALLRRKQGLDLRAALDEIGTPPFTTESVEHYNENRAEQANRGLFCRLARVAFVVSVFGAILCPGPACLGWIIAMEISIGFGIGFVVCVVAAVRLTNFVIEERGWWLATSLTDYAEPVPKFVLDLAFQIKERLPQVKFSVDCFIQKNMTPDPFLVVHYGDKHHFIAVWDEPKFEAEQKV